MKARAPITLDALDEVLVGLIQNGLPLVSRPYAWLGKQAGCSETEVIDRLARFREQGLFKRFGVVVRHHELGYRANAMVVWDVPDNQVAEIGRQLASVPWVNLCYRRPRRLPDWPYNLYCMIHGRDRLAVLRRVELLIRNHDLGDIDHRVLFSLRRFKQCGARYREQPRQQTQPESGKEAASHA
ncbi:siroheme decarboxylase subunit beta [Thiohalobacter sp.]|uniref:siroheme decarboxylase subunit beta n=1 Tax=Thiohalobacter sp. TaxID=2025948 RepID=UPI0026351A4F|nr:AsnC family protein [Thiohalobacter sp.]